MEQKLLYVASTYSHIHHFHRPYLKEFSRRGWTVHVACGGQVMELPEADQVIHVPFHKNISLIRNRKALNRLRQLLREGGYTLVSTHTSLASFFVRLAALGLKNRPLIANMVHGYLFDEQTPAAKRLLLAGAEKITSPVTDLLMTMNDWDTRYARKNRLGKQVDYVPGIGIPFDRFNVQEAESRSAGLELRKAYGVTEEQFAFIYGAEFSGRKSQETLIRALAMLPPQAVLFLPGEGILRQNCMNLAIEKGVADRVIFPGHITDMAPWYAAADAAVSSSRSEGLPFNIMEAMYWGLPVACTAVKGHVDLITDQVSGLLFPYGDADACSRQLRRLMDEPELGRRLSKQAGLEVAQYGLDRVLPQVMAEYDGLLAGEKRTYTGAAH